MDDEKKRATPPGEKRVGSRVEDRGRKNGGKRPRFFTKKWVVLVLITTALLVIGGCSAVMMSAKSVPLDRLDQIQFASTIYDVEGKEATKLGSSNREYISMDEIRSKELIENSFIAVEDRRFRQHNGVDFRSIARAVVANVREGRRAEGGGTITMQVARNVILESNIKTYTRKFQEVTVAWNLERDYSKDEILEAYLNFIYFGNDVQGIQMASKIYFDKDLTKDELKPHEAALLAGLPKAPSAYNPYQDEERAKERRNLVLGLMAEQGVITAAERDEYRKKELGVNREHLTKHLRNDRYQAYKHLVIQEAEVRFGLSEEELATGGYEIHTNLVPKAQSAMEKAFQNDALFQNHDELDGGATMVNPQTGGIAAVAGGREYKGSGYILRSTEEKMQPGSAIKPITVYAPVIQEKGYNEYSMVQDPPDFQVGNWEPQNFQKRSFGTLPLRDVLAQSLNVATAWLLDKEVGLPTAVQYAERLGLQLDNKDKGSHAALALGGLTQGVNTVEMAQAYTAFANNGSMTEAHAIESISTEDRKWEAEEEGDLKRDEEVLAPQTAYYLTRMMKYNVEQGTGTNARLPDGRDVAGKTGTTQNSRQAWFVGYSREYVMSAMVFNKQNGQVELSGGGYPARIFQQVMAEALAGTPVSRFENPGVPEPKPPFQLKPVELKGSFDADTPAIQLRWNDYDDRLSYRVERSENQSDWQAIGDTTDGTFTDDRLRLPDNRLDAIFGRGPTYSYRVIAIDTETGDEADPSNVVTFEIRPPEEPPEEPERPPGDQEGDQGDENDVAPENPGEPPGEDEQPGDEDGNGDEISIPRMPDYDRQNQSSWQEDEPRRRRP
ncbi:transglycosylase domain-containing protein [Desmospora profundinema]|uniref:Penicillin-binding protein 2A n=1 Tax=Desmospora profundinema TaxID=1571184 RepID=A0ABU1IMH8_9BACL|nr:PBP1A family penicillin-binding protein [Desmospora profundinema]MDR6225906.1 penicillin-binding protein 2A [Desmospora profundinema]